MQMEEVAEALRRAVAHAPRELGWHATTLRQLARLAVHRQHPHGPARLARRVVGQPVAVEDCPHTAQVAEDQQPVILSGDHGIQLPQVGINALDRAKALDILKRWSFAG